MSRQGVGPPFTLLFYFIFLFTNEHMNPGRGTRKMTKKRKRRLGKRKKINPCLLVLANKLENQNVENRLILCLLFSLRKKECSVNVSIWKYAATPDGHCA